MSLADTAEAFALLAVVAACPASLANIPADACEELEALADSKALFSELAAADLEALADSLATLASLAAFCETVLADTDISLADTAEALALLAAVAEFTESPAEIAAAASDALAAS